MGASKENGAASWRKIDEYGKWFYGKKKKSNSGMV